MLLGKRKKEKNKKMGVFLDNDTVTSSLRGLTRVEVEKRVKQRKIGRRERPSRPETMRIQSDRIENKKRDQKA